MGDRPGAGSTGGNSSAGEEEGRGCSCQGPRLWSLTVLKWLHRACPVAFGFPQPHCHGDLWGGDLPPRNLLVSVTLSPFGHCKDGCSQPYWWPVGVSCHCPLCSWFLASVQQRQPRLPPRADVRLLQKAHHSRHHQGPGQSRDLAGEGPMSSHLCSSLCSHPLVSWTLCPNPDDSESPR